MMRIIANSAAYFFITAVLFLSAISIFGVWDLFSSDVVTKSMQSIGLLAFVSFVIIIADNLIGRKNENQDPEIIQNSLSVKSFRGIRIFTLVTLVLSIVLLTFFGIMAIWEVFSGEVLYKALSSIGVIGFASLVIVITCLERERKFFFREKEFSIGRVLVTLVVLYLLFTTFFGFFGSFLW